jgi:hypothetical protein
MADVKDILGISRDNGAGEPAPSSRKEKTKELRGRPKGMSRETFNLLYGTHPIPQGALLSEIAKKEDPKPGPSYTQVCLPAISYQIAMFEMFVVASNPCAPSNGCTVGIKYATPSRAFSRYVYLKPCTCFCSLLQVRLKRSVITCSGSFVHEQSSLCNRMHDLCSGHYRHS